MTHAESANREAWERVVAECRAQLTDNKLRAARLKAAIKFFGDKAKRGDPCPRLNSPFPVTVQPFAAHSQANA